MTATLGVEAPIVQEERRPEGEIVLDQAYNVLGRFVIFPSKAAQVVATLWAAHTHVRTTPDDALAFETTPRLAILSKGPQSGKTRLMEILSRLSFNPRTVIDPTPATFAIGTHEKKSSTFVDEIDILFGRNGNNKQELVGLMNSGYKAGAVWERANKADMSVFAPLCLVGMERVFKSAQGTAALRSRCITITMEQAAGRKPARYRPRQHDRLLADVRRDMNRWVRRNVGAITEAWPTLPDGIEDRAEEVWEPLFMIADVAGGHWPQWIKDACREIALGKKTGDAEQPLINLLLMDLRDIFEATDKQGLPTVLLADELCELEHGRWLALWPYRDKAPRELAAMLSTLGLSAVQVWHDKRNQRGYKREQLQGFWQNLPDTPESEFNTEYDLPEEDD